MIPFLSLFLLIIILFDNIIELQCINVPHPSFFPSVYNVKRKEKNDNNNDKDNNEIDLCTKHLPRKFLVRQVPGDGSCLFNAIAISISHEFTKKHFEFDKNMKKMSMKLRKLAVEVLLNPNEKLHMEGDECITSNDLLDLIASHYNTSGEEYCNNMLKEKTWGGGPEIVAISNRMRRPIHVYELVAEGIKRHFEFKMCAQFGSPTYDNKPPIYILCADGRFPYIIPGFQKKQGDHFLALFPVDDIVLGPKQEVKKSKKNIDSDCEYSLIKDCIP